jgi:pimeloyl-ACP methyl ester carboxylesterase
MTTPTWVTAADGTALAVYDFGGDGAPVLFAHATGFHAHTWLPVIELLRDGFHCFAFDERGHGASASPENHDFSWRTFGDDARLVAEAVGLDRPFGVGHSAGGALLLAAEQDHPGRWAALWAFEPVVLPPAASSEGSFLAPGARRRRARFDSRQAAYDNYASKPPFNRFTPAALSAYVEHGLVSQPDGTVTLACGPEDEARTYEAAPVSGIWDLLPKVSVPVHGVRGELSDHPPAAFLPETVARLPVATMETMAGLSHFGPFEDPERIAASIRATFSPGR